MANTKAKLIISLFRLFGKLSLPMAQRIGRGLGTMAWLFPGRYREVTNINLGIAFPELTEAQRKDLARSSLRHTGQTMMEIPLLWEQPPERCLELVKEVEGQELLERTINEGKGLVLVAPHLGNWEILGLYFSLRYQMATLYSPPRIPEFEEYMIRVRTRLGSELARGDRRGLARLIGLLREGGIAAILPDQSPSGGKGYAYAPFFGMEVKTMTLVSKLVQKSGARPLMTFAERLNNSEGFRIIIRECEPGLADTDPVAATTALNQSVENCVREIPEQYQWEYKRFRRRPPGQVSPYKSDRAGKAIPKS
jgi:KDO2-lipid IV(A) lauroyltransferase